MKKLILMFTLALLSIACEKEEQAPTTPTFVGTMDKVVTSSNGNQYKWYDLDPSAGVWCACGKKESGGSWQLADNNECVTNGAGTDPCD